MKLSKQMICALKVLPNLIGQTKPIPICILANQYGIGQHIVEPVMVRLRRAGIVKALRGPHGGYMLAKPPKLVTLTDIMEAVDGAVFEAQVEVPESVSFIASNLQVIVGCWANGTTLQDLADKNMAGETAIQSKSDES